MACRSCRKQVDHSAARLVERWFALLADHQIKRGSHRSAFALEQAIRSHLTQDARCCEAHVIGGLPNGRQVEAILERCPVVENYMPEQTGITVLDSARRSAIKKVYRRANSPKGEDAKLSGPRDSKLCERLRVPR